MALLRRQWVALRSGGSLAAAILAAGCAAGRPPLHLRPEPIPFADTLPIPEPEARNLLEVQFLMEQAIGGEIGRVLSLRRATGKKHEALNLTRFDEVVASAWFEHRNAAAPMSPEEIRRGPIRDGGPDTTAALTLTAAKLQGISPGFQIRDGQGRGYLLKFDPKGFLYLSSAAAVITNRLFHAAGYNVPEDDIFVFRREQIAKVQEGATYLDAEFNEHPLTLALVDDILSRVDTLPDGRFLAVASRFVPGPPKGPFRFEGVRRDDPNDHYRHEHRRELRGLYVVSSWLNHVDMRFMNTMDAYVPPGYLKHYLIDFAASLGSGTIRPHKPREGAEYNFDFWPTMARIFTLGFYRVGWEGATGRVIHPSVGWMPAEEFDPASWKPNWPNRAFGNLTERDGYWGAKLVGSFTDEQIRAAVEAGRLPSRFAADTLTRILILRRDRIVRWWYGRVSPVEHPSIIPRDDGRPGFVLRFEDYGLRDGPWSPSETEYRWTFRQEGEGPAWAGRSRAEPNRGPRQELVVGPEPGGEGPRENEKRGRARAGAREKQAATAVIRLEVVRRSEMGRPEPRPARIYLVQDAGEAGYRIAGLEH